MKKAGGECIIIDESDDDDVPAKATPAPANARPTTSSSNTTINAASTSSSSSKAKGKSTIIELSSDDDEDPTPRPSTSTSKTSQTKRLLPSTGQSTSSTKRKDADRKRPRSSNASSNAHLQGDDRSPSTSAFKKHPGSIAGPSSSRTPQPLAKKKKLGINSNNSAILDLSIDTDEEEDAVLDEAAALGGIKSKLPPVPQTANTSTPKIGSSGSPLTTAPKPSSSSSSSAFKLSQSTNRQVSPPPAPRPSTSNQSTSPPLSKKEKVTSTNMNGGFANWSDPPTDSVARAQAALKAAAEKSAASSKALEDQQTAEEKRRREENEARRKRDEERRRIEREAVLAKEKDERDEKERLEREEGERLAREARERIEAEARARKAKEEAERAEIERREQEQRDKEEKEKREREAKDREKNARIAQTAREKEAKQQSERLEEERLAREERERSAELERQRKEQQKAAKERRDRERSEELRRVEDARREKEESERRELERVESETAAREAAKREAHKRRPSDEAQEARMEELRKLEAATAAWSNQLREEAEIERRSKSVSAPTPSEHSTARERSTSMLAATPLPESTTRTFPRSTFTRAPSSDGFADDPPEVDDDITMVDAQPIEKDARQTASPERSAKALTPPRVLNEKDETDDSPEVMSQVLREAFQDGLARANAQLQAAALGSQSETSSPSLPGRARKSSGPAAIASAGKARKSSGPRVPPRLNLAVESAAREQIAEDQTSISPLPDMPSSAKTEAEARPKRRVSERLSQIDSPTGEGSLRRSTRRLDSQVTSRAPSTAVSEREEGFADDEPATNDNQEEPSEAIQQMIIAVTTAEDGARQIFEVGYSDKENTLVPSAAEIARDEQLIDRHIDTELRADPKARKISGPPLPGEFSRDLQDHINRSDERFYALNGRESHDPSRIMLFQDMLDDAHRNEDPYAPPEKVRLATKLTSTGEYAYPFTPPFEFIYTNRVVYEQDIAPIQSDGCGCAGDCSDPANFETCACRKRQEANCQMGWSPSNNVGFAYNEDGVIDPAIIKAREAIWECNSSCGCGPSCINRVVGKKQGIDVDLVWTTLCGWGVRNPELPRGRIIKKGEPLGIYAGELITETESTDERTPIYDIVQRTYIFDLDNWTIQWNVNQLAEQQGSSGGAPAHVTKKKRRGRRPKHVDAQEGECEEVETKPKYALDAFHYGNWTRFCNHRCDSFNAGVTSVYVDEGHLWRPLLVLVATRNIHPGEEINISYYGDRPILWPGETVAQYQMRAKEARQATKPECRCLCEDALCRGSMFNVGTWAEQPEDAPKVAEVLASSVEQVALGNLA